MFVWNLYVGKVTHEGIVYTSIYFILVSSKLNVAFKNNILYIYITANRKHTEINLDMEYHTIQWVIKNIYTGKRTQKKLICFWSVYKVYCYLNITIITKVVNHFDRHSTLLLLHIFTQ